jgi:hypothetical protein
MHVLSAKNLLAQEIRMKTVEKIIKFLEAEKYVISCVIKFPDKNIEFFKGRLQEIEILEEFINSGDSSENS